MASLAHVQTVLLGLGIGTLIVLLAIWWQQQTFRWPLIVIICLLLAPALSWWSTRVFQVPDYRAGCDGLCPGFRGAPVSVFGSETAGGKFLPGMFALNSLIYLALLLGWGGICYALLARIEGAGQMLSGHRTLIGLTLLLLPFALAPLYLPAPGAHARGDPLRIAINAEREVFMYDNQSPAPVLRSVLEDVRPRRDGTPGMRVCLRAYTFFYISTGHIYLDMAPEGVHSTGGGVLPVAKSCWD